MDGPPHGWASVDHLTSASAKGYWASNATKQAIYYARPTTSLINSVNTVWRAVAAWGTNHAFVGPLGATRLKTAWCGPTSISHAGAHGQYLCDAFW